MSWRTHIQADPQILMGKPIVKGTRLSVEFILDLFSAGWTSEEVLANYPALTSEALSAVFACAAETMREFSFYAPSTPPQ